MQIPFLVLSYDSFDKTKKLFSYERDGLHTLPVFTDASKATRFAATMTETLQKHFNDNRALKTQLCTEPKMALKMFETITAYTPDLVRIVINPNLSTRDDEHLTNLNDLSWIENFQDIDDVLEQLQDAVLFESEFNNSSPESKG